jgi:hypothetical protein
MPEDALAECSRERCAPQFRRQSLLLLYPGWPTPHWRLQHEFLCLLLGLALRTLLLLQSVLRCGWHFWLLIEFAPDSRPASERNESADRAVWPRSW